MKNINIKLGVCLLAALSLLACKKENELSFSPNYSNPNETKVEVGKTIQVSVNSYGVKSSTPYPVQNVNWTVANDYYASIDNNGVVTGKKVGVTSVCGTFDGGKVVYVTIVVFSSNNQYVEPLLGGSDFSVTEYETTLTDANRFKTRGVDGKYAVFQDTCSKYKDKFQIYFFNQFNGGVISTFADKNVVEEVRTKFLPDRYNVTGENTFADILGNKAVTRSDEYGDGVFYNFGSTDLKDVYAQYSTDATTYINGVADKNNYTPEKLGLTLPFVIEADQTSVDTYKNKALQAISGSTKFSVVEQEITDDANAITKLYLDGAAKWALEEWCWKVHIKTKGAVMDGGLNYGHDQSQYPEVSWNRVLELDELAEIEFGEKKAFKDIDVAAQSYGKKYFDVAGVADTTKFCTSEKSTGIRNQFASIQKNLQKSGKETYNEKCWTMMTTLCSLAQASVKATYSYEVMNKIATSCKYSKWDAKDKSFASDSYYYDVPTKANIEDYQAELKKAYDSYDKSKYTSANWQKLENIYLDAVAALDESVSKTGSRDILDVAKQAMYAIPVK